MSRVGAVLGLLVVVGGFGGAGEVKAAEGQDVATSGGPRDEGCRPVVLRVRLVERDGRSERVQRLRVVPPRWRCEAQETEEVEGLERGAEPPEDGFVQFGIGDQREGRLLHFAIGGADLGAEPPPLLLVGRRGALEERGVLVLGIGERRDPARERHRRLREGERRGEAVDDGFVQFGIGDQRDEDEEGAPVTFELGEQSCVAQVGSAYDAGWIRCGAEASGCEPEFTLEWWVDAPELEHAR